MNTKYNHSAVVLKKIKKFDEILDVVFVMFAFLAPSFFFFFDEFLSVAIYSFVIIIYMQLVSMHTHTVILYI